MPSSTEEPSRPELDPLPAAAVGTVLTGIASLFWPELISATVTLAALTSFVIWVRALRTLRRPRSTGEDPTRMTPLIVLGGAGWALALFVAPVLPVTRPLILSVLAVGLWTLARSRFQGGSLG